MLHVIGPENFSTGEKENTVVNRRSKFLAVVQKPAQRIIPKEPAEAKTCDVKTYGAVRIFSGGYISIYGTDEPLRRGPRTMILGP